MSLVRCKECKREISSSAACCPHCGKKRTSGCAMVAAGFVGFFVLMPIVAIMFSSSSGSKPEQSKGPSATSKVTARTQSPSLTASVPADDLDQFITRFGKPDQVYTSDKEEPAPKIISRQLRYFKESVSAVYVIAPPGKLPITPSTRWKLWGFVDPAANVRLSSEDVLARMSKRDAVRPAPVHRPDEEALRQIVAKSAELGDWKFEKFSDPIGGDYRISSVESADSFNLDFPYRGEQHATLMVRRTAKKLDVMVAIEQGQIMCRVTGCEIKVKFDDGTVQTFDASGPADYSTTMLFLDNPQRFVSQIEGKKQVYVQFPTFQNGQITVLFKTGAYKDPTGIP